MLRDRQNPYNSDIDCVGDSLNFEEVLKNYNTRNDYTVGKLISSLTIINLNLFVCWNELFEMEHFLPAKLNC